MLSEDKSSGPVALSVMRALFNQTHKGDKMINIFLLAMIACGEEEKEDTAPTSEPVEETSEEVVEEEQESSEENSEESTEETPVEEEETEE
jgi:hypothetical protein